MIFSMNAVEEYFQTHLERRTWQSLTGDTKTAAVETAKTDVKLAVSQDPLDLSDLLIFSAVCEQALYVAKRALAERENNRGESTQLKSESIEGIGKREYFQKAESGTGTDVLAPRAELFLARHPAFQTLNFTRG